MVERSEEIREMEGGTQKTLGVSAFISTVKMLEGLQKSGEAIDPILSTDVESMYGLLKDEAYDIMYFIGISGIIDRVDSADTENVDSSNFDALESTSVLKKNV